MKTIKLNISDNIYSHIMFFLKSLKSDELEIIEENKKEESAFSKSRNSIKATKELAINSNINFLSSYVKSSKTNIEIIQ